jgi:GntR family transcriptional regulator
MINPRSGVPLHLQVAAVLRERIVAGTYRPGQKLPAAARLAYDLDVGLGTVQRAIAELRREGLVASGTGMGTWVREPDLREEITIPAGALLRGRAPSQAERVEMDLDDGVFLIEVHTGGKVRLYPTDRYELRARG